MFGLLTRGRFLLIQNQVVDVYRQLRHGGGGTCLMYRLGGHVFNFQAWGGVMFTSSKVIPRILVSKVFHPTSFPQKLSGGGVGWGTRV